MFLTKDSRSLETGPRTVYTRGSPHAPSPDPVLSDQSGPKEGSARPPPGTSRQSSMADKVRLQILFSGTERPSSVPPHTTHLFGNKAIFKEEGNRDGSKHSYLLQP